MDFSRTSQAMRLLVYNNYFSNRVAIKATKNNGFNREQLDSIDEAIKNILAAL